MEPATVSSTSWRPSVSKCWASILNRLAWCNKCSPWKRRESSVTKVRPSHETAKEQSERSSNTKQKEIPGLRTPEPHLKLRLVASLPPSRNGPNLCHAVLVWYPQVHHSRMTHLWMRQSQMNKRDLIRRSDKQMFWSDGSVLWKKWRTHTFNDTIWLNSSFSSEEKEGGITWTGRLHCLSTWSGNNLPLRFFLLFPWAHHLL